MIVDDQAFRRVRTERDALRIRLADAQAIAYAASVTAFVLAALLLS